MRDLTKGSPSRQILLFALPIFFGNLLQISYSMIDIRIVGSFLGKDALAAVGAVTTLSNLIVGFLLGLSNGFAIITAQAFGAKDDWRQRRSFAMALKLGLAIVAILTVMGIVFLNQILHFLNVTDDLFLLAKQYSFIIVAGMVATLLYDVFAATLRAFGDTVMPLVILAVTVVLNILGDIFFIVVLKTGVWGAAFATIMAQLVAAVVCGIYMMRKYDNCRLWESGNRRSDSEKGSDKESGNRQSAHGKSCTRVGGSDRAMAKSMLGSGLSMGFMSSLVNIGSLTLQTAINKLGNDIIVAHTAARKISEVYMIMFSVFGQTMATYCGQNLGAGKISRIKKGIWLSILYTCIWSFFMLIASYTIGRWLVHLVTGSNNETVIVNAVNYLKFDTIFYFVTAVICVVRNAMQGLGERVVPLISSGLEMVGKMVIAATLVPWFGYTGVIVAEPLVWFIMVIPLVVRIFRMPVLKKVDAHN